MRSNHLFSSYQKKIEEALKLKILQLGPQNGLRNACEYALLNGGKRFRPILVLLIAESLGLGINVMEAALGVEFFHTASLVADDLPCMDDDDLRRNKPSLHCQFGEASALLSTYALISAGYLCLIENGRLLKETNHPLREKADFLSILAIENVSINTGIEGAAAGQYFDLKPAEISLDSIKEVLRQKTVTLFEISFVLGWIFGGGALEKLSIVKKCAAHFGMAFQIIDDLGDQQQDLAHGHMMNIANLFGEEKAIEMLFEEKTGFKETLEDLNLSESPLSGLLEFLNN